jgi:hypothetical protein
MDRGGGRFGFGLSHIKTGDDGAKVSWSWIHAKGVRPRLWHTHPTIERAMNSCAAGSVLEQAQQSKRSTESSAQLFVALRGERKDQSFWDEK